MKQYISKERAIYEDMYHGQFSKALAQWAVGNMKRVDGDELVPVEAVPIEEVGRTLKEHGAELPEKCKWTAWYLWHMTLADYPLSITSDKQRAYFVYETIMDPDGCPANVLDCFVTKMCNAGEVIYWEDML